MDVLVRNAEGNLSHSDRDYAALKLGRLDRFFHQANKVEIVHREVKAEHRVEVTVFADGLTIRGEEHDASIRAAIDKVSEKLDNRLRRLNNRLVSHHRRGGRKVPDGLLEEHHEEAHSEHIEIRERKQFVLKPMQPEEAALQLEMVGHPFFMFRNETTGQVEVLYRRKDGKYGLLQPEG